MQHIINAVIAIGIFTMLSCQPKVVDTPEQDILPAIDSSLLDVAFITGQFNPSERQDFVLIDEQYADRSGLYLYSECYEQFVKMWSAAKRDSIELTIRSATRNFNYQKRIWENKWNGNTALSDGSHATEISDPKSRAIKILLYSSMPGSSRHHWGTDIDLNNFNNSYFESGRGLNEYKWLQANAANFGFYQPYINKETSGRTGYEEEKWHWSYFPVSAYLTDFAEHNLSNDMIGGFLGASTAVEIDVVGKYVLGVAPHPSGDQ